MAEADLQYRIGADAGGFEQAMKNVMTHAGNTIAAFAGFTGVVALLKNVADQAIKNEAATYGLASAVKSLKTGTQSGFETLNKYAESMSAASGIAEDELKGALQKLVYETGNTEVAQKSLKTAIDLSKGAHIGLEAAAKMVGKAYEGNFSVLKRYGIEIANGTSGMDALAKITDKFGGAEDSYLASTSGRINKAKNSLTLFETEIGSAFLPAMGDAADAVTKFLHSWTAQGEIETATANVKKDIEKQKDYIESAKETMSVTDKDSKAWKTASEGLAKHSAALQTDYGYLKQLNAETDKHIGKVYQTATATGNNDDTENASQKNKVDGYKEVGKAFSNLATLSRTKNKELFEVGKAASMGAIIASTAEAVMKTGAELGYPLAIPFQAMATVAGGVALAEASSASFNPGGAATGLYADESMISTFQPREIVIPQRFSDMIASGKMSLQGGNSSTSTTGDTHIHVYAGNKSVDQTLREIKTYLNNNRGGRLTRSDGSLNI